MKLKQLALMTLFFSGPSAHASDSVINTIDSFEQSLDPLSELAQTFASDPDFYGKVLNICVDGQCLTLDLTYLTEKGGMPETISSSEWSRDVATVVKAATGGVSGSASVKVTVTRKETNKDGSSKETKVDVEVKVEGKK